MYEDTNGAINWSVGQGKHNAKKHIGVRYHLVRDMVEANELVLAPIDTADQVLTFSPRRWRRLLSRGTVESYCVLPPQIERECYCYHLLLEFTVEISAQLLVASSLQTNFPELRPKWRLALARDLTTLCKQVAQLSVLH